MVKIRDSVSYSLNSLQGLIQGIIQWIIRVTKGDTRSVEFGSRRDQNPQPKTLFMFIVKMRDNVRIAFLGPSGDSR